MAVGLDLDQYQLKNRVLLVFAPTPEDARYLDQHAYLGEGEDLLSRSKIVVFGIFEDGPSFAEDRAVSSEDSERAREDFGMREGEFGLHLLDLDGTEILRSIEPIPVEDLAEVVEQKAE
jgi:hypothetical protein